MLQVRARHVGMDQHRDDEAAEGRLRQRLGKDQVGQCIGIATAEPAIEHQPEQTGLAEPLQHGARHHPVAFPGLRVRLDLAGEEARDLVLQQGVLWCQIDVCPSGLPGPPAAPDWVPTTDLHGSVGVRQPPVLQYAQIAQSTPTSVPLQGGPMLMSALLWRRPAWTHAR